MCFVRQTSRQAPLLENNDHNQVQVLSSLEVFATKTPPACFQRHVTETSCRHEENGEREFKLHSCENLVTVESYIYYIYI